MPHTETEIYEWVTWKEHSLESRLLEKLRRAAETFVDPKESEVTNIEGAGKLREGVVVRTESIVDKPHRVSWKLELI